jgi:L-malate glycosyltransferase
MSDRGMESEIEGESGLRIGITCYPSAGGSGIVATELGKELARRGHDVHFITHAVPVRLREFEERIAFHPVEAESYPLFNHQPYALNLAAKMSEVIERENLEILHVHYALPHAVSAYLAKQIVRPRPVRVVTTLHGTDITLVGLQPSFFSVTKFSIEQSDAVTAVSGWLRDQTRSIFQVTSPIEVIHNFVDLTRFAPGKDPRRRASFAAAPDEVVFMHASNFRPVKNTRRVIEVFAAVAERVPAKLLLIGEGPDVSACQKLARELKVASRVAFLGEQEYIEALLPIADVFLLPSAHESFGLVALEAMSCGVPVIATSVGGMPEVIEDGVSGFLADPTDLQAMTEIAVALARDPARRRAVGEAARERAAAFATGMAVERYVALYRSLLARPEPEPAPPFPSPSPAAPPSRTMKPTMRPKSPARAEK